MVPVLPTDEAGFRLATSMPYRQRGGARLSSGCLQCGPRCRSADSLRGAKPNLENGPADEVKIGNVSGLGGVLVDGEGLTLYQFATDTQGEPSRCVGLCAEAWPPLTLPPGTEAPIAGPGIKSGLLGSEPRADGSMQITYNGWPLYTWPQDTAPGEATGQGLTNLGGRWWVVDAAGDGVHTP